MNGPIKPCSPTNILNDPEVAFSFPFGSRMTDLGLTVKFDHRKIQYYTYLESDSTS